MSAGLTEVFVYGTLRAGGSNHRLLGSARLRARLRTVPAYTLYDLGAYPALAEGGETAVLGEVWALDAATLAACDRLEDCPRTYQRRPVQLEDGRTVQGWLMPAASLQGFPVIACGDWLAHWTQRESGLTAPSPT